MKEGWTYKKLPEISENLDSLRKPVTKKNRTTAPHTSSSDGYT